MRSGPSSRASRTRWRTWSWRTTPPRAWAEIDLAALRHNLGVAAGRAPGSKNIAVVKANGKAYSARKNVKVTIGGCGG